VDCKSERAFGIRVGRETRQAAKIFTCESDCKLSGGLACVVYSTIPLFWLMIHPFADRWAGATSLSVSSAAADLDGDVGSDGRDNCALRTVSLSRIPWLWIPASVFICCGSLHLLARRPELQRNGNSAVCGGSGDKREQRLATGGIRARVRHPCILRICARCLAWSIGTDSSYAGG